MPQVYRRHSEHAQRPVPEPRRRSSLAPQPTDADDSIVLSDIVRMGEASRLRRRGAMRLDHGLPRPSSGVIPPLSASIPSPRVFVAPPEPERAPTPSWPIVAPAGDDDYAEGVWRDWNIEEGGGGLLQPDDARGDQEEEGYMLFCGGEEQDPSAVPSSSSTTFEPSPLPVRPASGQLNTLRVPRTNGCGAVIHMRAFPQRPRGVWVGKEEASASVVALDASYFDRGVVAKMMKSACGCVREGIGCAACGNTLGTRYLPCQAASEGIFARHTTVTPARPAKPLAPSGPSYWRCRSAPPRASSSTSSSTRPSTNFYVYTFFADHVSSSPAYTFPEQPQPTEAPADVLAQAGGGSRPTSPSLPISYGYQWTSSPRPFSPYPLPPAAPSPSSTASYSPIFAPPPQSSSPPPPRSPRTPPPRLYPYPYPRTLQLGFDIGEDAASGSGDRGMDTSGEEELRPVRIEIDSAMTMGMSLDPDGVLIDVDELEEPVSPDKTGNETMIWPGR